MTKERNIILGATLGVILVFAGCIPSLHPLYHEEDRITVDGLEGEWVATSGHEQYTFELAGGDSLSYLVRYTELPQKGFVSRDSSKAVFDVNIVELGGYYFMDFYPEDPSLDDLNSLLVVHLMPVHTFARLELKNDTVRIWRFDPNWLDELFGENRIRISHEVVDDMIVLTASTDDLQKFVTKYADEPGAYVNPEILIRK